MKQEHVVIIAAVGAGAGATVRGLGLTTGNRLYDAVIGLAVAAAGFFTKIDMLSDFAEGAGIGFFLDAVL